MCVCVCVCVCVTAPMVTWFVICTSPFPLFFVDLPKVRPLQRLQHIFTFFGQTQGLPLYVLFYMLFLFMSMFYFTLTACNTTLYFVLSAHVDRVNMLSVSLMSTLKFFLLLFFIFFINSSKFDMLVCK